MKGQCEKEKNGFNDFKFRTGGEGGGGGMFSSDIMAVKGLRNDCLYSACSTSEICRSPLIAKPKDQDLSGHGHTN